MFNDWLFILIFGVIMEFITTISQIGRMIDNRIIGKLKLTNSHINFRGINNILFCDNNIVLEDVILDFNGDNSIVYLCSDLNSGFKLTIYNNSTCFIGEETIFGSSVSLKIFENKNIIIGDDCIIGDNVIISNSDGYSLYDVSSKKRFNFSNSIYIGDHVFLGDNVYVSKGVKIGSGSFIDNYSLVNSYTKVPSNKYAIGNPIKFIKNDVFFTKDFLGSFNYDDSINSQYYKSDVFIYEFKDGETLDLDKLENIFRDLDVVSRQEFLKKLFINNKRKNRFCIV